MSVDEFGKDISGTGMDTNIIGRIKIKGENEPEYPDITSIILLDLTEQSHGNAVGMGLADLITRKFYEEIDFQATYENTLTSNFFERGKMPIVADTGRLALQYALRTCGLDTPQDARIINIKSTLTLDEIFVSDQVLEEVKNQAHIEITDETRSLF